MNHNQLSVDLGLLEERFFKDGEFLREVLENYKNTCKSCFDDFRVSLINKDCQLLVKTAHKLRGSTLNFTSDSLVEKLAKIEFDAMEGNMGKITFSDIDNMEKNVFDFTGKLSQIVKDWSQ